MARKMALLLCTLVFGLIVPMLELNDTHVFNPAWPAHARLHEVWQLASNVMLALLAVGLAWRHDAVRVASLIASSVTAGFLVAYATRALYGGSMLGVDATEKVVAGINVSAVAVGVMSAATATLLWIALSARPRGASAE